MKRKNIDLTENAIKIITLEAVKKDTCFKLYVEQLLEEKAKKLSKENTVKTSSG